MRWLVPLVLSVACTHTVTKEVDDDSDLADLDVRPSELYSGFDGAHSFTAPFAVYNASDDVEVTSSPSSAVKISSKTLAKPDGDEGKYFFAEVRAAGDVKLTVTSKGRTATAMLHVTDYDAARYATGKARYETGPDAAHPPCTKCHEGQDGIDHSPSALASVTDTQIGLILSTGLSTSNFPIAVDKSQYPNGHKWTTGPGAEQDGLITYLRALEPKGFK